MYTISNVDKSMIDILRAGNTDVSRQLRRLRIDWPPAYTFLEEIDHSITTSIRFDGGMPVIVEAAKGALETYGRAVSAGQIDPVRLRVFINSMIYTLKDRLSIKVIDNKSGCSWNILSRQSLEDWMSSVSRSNVNVLSLDEKLDYDVICKRFCPASVLNIMDWCKNGESC